VDELADAMRAEFAAESRMLHAAEGEARIRLHHAVDEHGARFDAGDEFLALGGVARPGARAQAERRRIRDAHRFGDRRDAEYRGDRTEQLLTRDRPRWIDVAHHGRRVETA